MRNWFICPVLLAVTLTTSCSDSVVDSYPFPKGKVFFPSPPLDVSGARWFIGMGEPNVLPKDHGGFVLNDPYVFPASVPVFAVADGVITLASLGTRSVPSIPDAPEALWGHQYDDHLLVLKVSDKIKVNYAHVTDFYPPFAAKVGNLPRDEVGHKVAVIVHAGDTLGFVGPHGAMDFSVTDHSLHLNLLNPSRYPDDVPYSGDVLDYYQEPALSRILAITKRQEPPRGGKIDYDVAGRIVGNWFLEGTTSFIQWSHQLAVVYHHVFGDRIVISDGSPMRDVPGIEGPGAPDVWWVKGNAPAPETIGVADGMIKYMLIYGKDVNHPEAWNEELQSTQAVALIQMLDPGRIRVQIFKGVTDADGFTASAKVYVR